LLLLVLLLLVLLVLLWVLPAVLDVGRGPSNRLLPLPP
jgi:hypothetical protein